MLSVSLLLLLAAFVLAIVNAAGKCPLWPSVMLLCVWGLLGVLGR